MEQLKKYIAWLLCRLGFSANGLTVLGLLFALGSGALVYRGHLRWAAVALLFSGFLDMMDGAVARLSGSNDKFGGILDSSFDRYGDALILGGVLFYYARQSSILYAGLAFSALMGSFEISYVRARTECEMPSCRVGFWERGERIVFLSLGLLFHNVALVLWILGIGTHWTAMQRLLRSRRYALVASAEISSPAPPSMRQQPLYWAKVLALAALAALLRPPF